MEEFKSNSYKSKQQTEKPEIKQVVNTPAKVKKKSGWSKFKEEFISEDGKSIGDYLVFDVLVPAAKKTISDLVNNGTDMLLYGNARKPGQNNMPGSRVSYRSYYDNAPQRTYGYSSNRRQSNYDEIILGSRAEAENVLTEMNDIIRRYGLVRVSDLYDLVGLNGSYTDNNYGWTDLRYADIIRERDGYLLKFPKPMPID